VLVRSAEPEHADRDKLVEALVDHPRQIQRPAVVRGDRAVVARPPECLLELLGPN